MRLPTLAVFITLILAASALKTIPQHGAESTSGKYIVKLKGDVTSLAANDFKASFAIRPKPEYSMTTFTGFAGTFTAEELARIKDSDLVCSISPTRGWSVLISTPGGIRPARHYNACPFHHQTNERNLGPRKAVLPHPRKRNVYLRQHCRRRHLRLRYRHGRSHNPSRV